ncbi:hypothetical protein [Leadbettera azotonutricia]|uniref:Uncharacterized protein n=1 Tax=Leadbettera azotonutricia (strain ATCC BAA-888 / DSM 13862 / ZAS-9) TaxID=545695 RepID=F5YCX3_LEAAZ|nr:hypothetical protein [Leadbettera azotonutricia]AEF83158.1 hypothetical protein TREAZ_0398 [Leadbettera azotonutricia ZAS-9]
MKTIEEYMNDPDIQTMPEYLREIHAARHLIQDETVGMSAEEEAKYHRKKTDELFARLGLPQPQYVDFSGQGRLDLTRLPY